MKWKILRGAVSLTPTCGFLKKDLKPHMGPNAVSSVPSYVHREHETGCGAGGRLSACWEVSFLHSLVVNELFAVLCRDQIKCSIPDGSFLCCAFFW